jgi:hypothetical protein
MTTSSLTNLADHPARAFRVKTTVFLPESRNDSVKLARGERLFILTDKGLEEAPYGGPDEVSIALDHWGCWPVVAIRVRDAHADAWRSVSADAAARMMTRVRSALRARQDHPDAL